MREFLPFVCARCHCSMTGDHADVNDATTATALDKVFCTRDQAVVADIHSEIIC